MHVCKRMGSRLRAGNGIGNAGAADLGIALKANKVLAWLDLDRESQWTPIGLVIVV